MTVFSVILDYLKQILHHLNLGTQSQVISWKVVSCCKWTYSFGGWVVECEIIIHPDFNEALGSHPNHPIGDLKRPYFLM